MESWRRRALDTFPELREELLDPERFASFEAFWPELVSMVEDSGNEDLLRRLYAYARGPREGGDL